MTLDEALRAAAKRGDISHLTLAPRNDGTWQAGYRVIDSAGYLVAEDADPCEALIKVLTATKRKQNAAPPKKVKEVEDLL